MKEEGIRHAHELNEMGAGGQGTLTCEGNRKIQDNSKDQPEWKKSSCMIKIK